MTYSRLKNLAFTVVVALSTSMLSIKANGQPQPYPAGFKVAAVQVGEVALHVRVGGTGPAVVLLHGFANTGDMWTPLAVALAENYRVVVPDLRGMGRSGVTPNGYDKKSQAHDIRQLLESLSIDKATVVGHDIGTMVAYAYAATYPEKTIKLVVMDAPIPGVAPWEQIVRSAPLWHFDFGGEDALRLVKGRERIYLDRFWNDFAGDRARIDELTRAHYAKLYSRPGVMGASFKQFHTIRQDEKDNVEFSKKRLTMPVLAIGGEKSFGATQALVMRNVADNVKEVVIPGAGHWLMEEAPSATVSAITEFLKMP